MNPGHSRCAGRAFYQVLEESPPGRRFLLAANPPGRARPSDIRALVKKSFTLRYSDIEGMYHYAKLACALAEALCGGDADLCDARGEAWMQLGNALRILGHLPSSREALMTSEEKLSKGSGRHDLQASLWEYRGALYRDWRDFGPAEEYLVVAAKHYSHSGQLADKNRCLISRALCAGKSGDPRRAVRLAERAARRINPKTRPDLAVSALHTLCWHLVDVGNPTLALACYVEGESLFEGQADELIQAHRSWLRAHIDQSLGLFPSAEVLYRRAAEGFAKHEIAYDRALVLLDLCLPLAAQHRLEELAATAAEILPEFERIGIGREAMASRLLLSAATQATLAERVEGLVKVSRLVQQALPLPRKLPEL